MAERQTRRPAQGQAFTLGLGLRELREQYYADLERGLSPNEMVVLYGTSEPRFLEDRPDHRVTAPHLKTRLWRDIKTGYEYAPEENGDTEVWYLYAPRSILSAARKRMEEGRQDVDEASMSFPNIDDQLVLRRIHDKSVADVRVTVDNIPYAAQASAKVIFTAPVSGALTQRERALFERRRAGVQRKLKEAEDDG